MTGLLVLLLAAPPVQEEPLVFAAEVEVVRVDVLVTRDGEPVRGLKAEHFELKDNGIPQALDRVTFQESAVDALLVLDVSASVVGRKLGALQDAAGAFLDGLSRDDRAALVGFQHSIVTAVPLTRQLSRVRFGLETVPGGGATALHDAVYLALRLPEASDRRSAVVVFSDGVDNRSWLSGKTVVEAAGRSDVVVYGVDAREPGDPRHRFLEDVCRATGGRVWRVRNEDDLPARFLEVLDDIRARYLLSYTPRGVDVPGWHDLEVKLEGVKGDVLARPAYYRPRPPPARR
jgi:Ca-activated chloride channel family protein